MKPIVAIFALLLLPSASALTGTPDCSGPERWPTSMAFVHLKNAGTIQVISNNDASNVEVYLVSAHLGKQLPPNPSFKRDTLKHAP